MSTINEKDYKEYYIAYFDVLGYKSFFDNANKVEILDFLNSCIQLANDTIRKSINLPNSAQQIHIKSFSDNFMILLDANLPEERAVETLSSLMALLQTRFLKKYSILIRGCITRGKAYLDKNIIFGQGLINAVLLEQRALFPRIVIDKEALNENILNNDYIAKDEDEEYYVNYLNYFIGREFDNHNHIYIEERDSITVIRKNIIKLVNKYGRFNRQLKDPQKILETERTISKYAWVLTKYNQYCDLINGQVNKRLQLEPIPYKMVLYYRLMKCEIIVEKER